LELKKKKKEIGALLHIDRRSLPKSNQGKTKATKNNFLVGWWSFLICFGLRRSSVGCCRWASKLSERIKYTSARQGSPIPRKTNPDGGSVEWANLRYPLETSYAATIFQNH